jgi:hypothetical protein
VLNALNQICITLRSAFSHPEKCIENYAGIAVYIGLRVIGAGILLLLQNLFLFI